MLNKANNSAVNVLRKHDNDTGSSAVQIVKLTSDISRLTGHFAVEKKDYSGRRGLMKKISARKRFMSYLKRTDPEMYKKVLETLGLKK